SIIIPIYNGATWIENCFKSILKQTAIGVLKLELCICDDCSTDNTPQLLSDWKSTFEDAGVALKVHRNADCTKGGKIVGSQFRRDPANSTVRYTKWANNLTQEQLNLQVFTSHGPTVIMPTWFCNRRVFERIGGFCECKKGCPEDLVFFNKHLNMGGQISRVDEILLVYTYHTGQATFSVNEETIWNIRVQRLEQTILGKYIKFTIWNAGKQGRKFYNSLSEENRAKVVAFCDVDVNKIGKKYRSFDEHRRRFNNEVDIIHFQKAVPPFIVCVKTDLTDGAFENNLQMLNLKEGDDYVMFS
ncbi:hypothetical protein HUJ04_008868, partial [Dendroctonus ponderosae]